MAKSYKQNDGNLAIPQTANTRETIGRNQGSKVAIHPSMYRQSGESSKPAMPISRTEHIQGNTNPTTIAYNPYDLMKDIDRSNRRDNETSKKQQADYHTNFPKISSNFDRQTQRGNNEKNDPPSGNTNFPKSDQVPEPAPYTVIQTYADRLRHNQAKKGISIKLTEPKITTKQGLPSVLYVKDEVIKDLAAACKYTLFGKFVYTMPKVELIRKNFILQTQLSGGVKIAHFNSRHIYIDLDNELDYNMVWTKQRMTIAGQIIRIQAWTPSFKPNEKTPLVPIWVSLPELPWHCYNKEFITGLLSPIGRVLYLNSASVNKTRGNQARLKVQVDLTKARPPHIWIGYKGEDITDGRWQKIDYDSIPGYCFYCKHQGHKEVDCIIKQRDEDNKRKNDLDKNKNRKDNTSNIP